MNQLEKSLKILTFHKFFTANTLDRVAEINHLVDKETIPHGYDVDDEGVWHIQEKKDAPPSREWVCSPLWVTGYTRDYKNENHGRVLEFQDVDGYKHTWTMPMDLLAGENSKILAALLNMGLRISPKRQAKERLLEYIAQCNPIRKARCVSQSGCSKELLYYLLKRSGIFNRKGSFIKTPPLLNP